MFSVGSVVINECCDMRNIALLIAYDGTAYWGWQNTGLGFSIEEILGNRLEQILQEKVVLQAASRTDAGVHAYGQVVNFLTKHEKIDFVRIKHSLNQMLPKDISIRSMIEVPLTFHPTLDCTSKEYHYSLCYEATQLPHERHYAWHYGYPLDVALMRQAAEYFVGTHDYTSFCNLKQSQGYEDHTRTVLRLEVKELSGKNLLFRIEGSNFLYKMVRNLVGTVTYVGSGRLSLEEASNLLLKKDRTCAGITAPAHGLCLHRVIYPSGAVEFPCKEHS